MQAMTLMKDRPVLSSERTPHKKQDRNCQKIINIWSRARDGAWYQDLLTGRQSQCDFDFDYESLSELLCWGGVEYLHHDPASGRGDEKGSLKSETVKYGRESQGTRTQERQHWQGLAAYIKYRPVLSSERAPHKSKTVTVKQ
jgi:hypothetical protein